MRFHFVLRLQHSFGIEVVDGPKYPHNILHLMGLRKAVEAPVLVTTQPALSTIQVARKDPFVFPKRPVQELPSPPRSPIEEHKDLSDPGKQDNNCSEINHRPSHSRHSITLSISYKPRKIDDQNPESSMIDVLASHDTLLDPSLEILSSENTHQPIQLPTPEQTVSHTTLIPQSATSTLQAAQNTVLNLASRKQTSKNSKYQLSDFVMVRTLGTGSFGRVHLVQSRHNSRHYAIKVLSKEKVVHMKQVEHTNSERIILQQVCNPFLVNLWGTFQDSNYLYMVMDFVAGGELFTLLRKSQRFPDPVAKFYAAQVCLALDYLHSQDIIYRDLKPENILLGADGHIKLTDFGFAKFVPDITWTLCGTPDYLAPEIVQSKSYNKSVDWYALGVLVFEMLAGYPPFFSDNPNPMKLYEKIIACRVRYPPYFTPNAKSLLSRLLTPDLTKRFGNLLSGSRDVFSHVWFQEVNWDRLYRKDIPAPYVPKVDCEGDAGNFDWYPEVEGEYGKETEDPFEHLFKDF